MACEKLTEVDTLLTADSVEWCPCGDLQQVLASGTYQLNEKTGLRRGGLAMYEWNHSTWVWSWVHFLSAHAWWPVMFLHCRLTKILEKESSKISDGILDMKWYGWLDVEYRTFVTGTTFCRCIGSEEAVLALALSSGAVSFLRMDQESVWDLACPVVDLCVW